MASAAAIGGGGTDPVNYSNSTAEISLNLSYSSSSFDGDHSHLSDIGSDTASDSSHSFSSDTASSQNSPEGSEVEEIHPFLYEPIVSTSSGEDSSDSDEDLSLRLLNLNW